MPEAELPSTDEADALDSRYLMPSDRERPAPRRRTRSHCRTRQPAGNQQRRGVSRQVFRANLGTEAHVREGIGDQGIHLRAPRHRLGQTRDDGAAAGEHDVVDLIELGGGEEELQRPANFLRQTLDKRTQHCRLVVVW